MGVHSIGTCRECDENIALVNGVEAGHLKHCSQHVEGYP